MNIHQLFQLRARSFGIAAIGALAIGGSAANAASATSNATATVVTPIAISNTADLGFGKFSAGTGGTVVMSAAGVRSATGNVVLLTGSGSVGAVAAFNVTGDASATYAITLPGSAATITRVSGTETMSVGTFTSNPSGTGTLSGAGAQTVNVGGTLTVASAQVVGSYTGTFSVSVEYN